jgi:diguanylate cyclase (GGDEF)-like protein/PAS domain S-box-containing protein
MLFFDRAPLKSKLIGIIALMTILVLGSSVIAIVAYDRHNFISTRLKQQQVLGAIVSDRSSAALAFGDEINATGNLEALRTNPTIAIACLFRGGQLFAHFHAVGARVGDCPQTVPAFVEHQLSDDWLETVQPVLMNNSPIGALYIVSNLEERQQRSRNIAGIALLFLVSVGSIGLLLASKLIRYVIFPLALLGRTATVITKDKDYSVRSQKGFDDDIGLLIDTFNGMLETIEAQNTALIHSEEALKSIINDAPDLMQIVNREGSITFVNRPDDPLYGRSGRRASSIFDGLDPEQRTEAKNALQTVFVSGVTAQFETYDDESDTWYANHIGPLRENGVINAALVMKRDISALKLAHEKLKQIAFYDPLTGLPNRRLFKDRLDDELIRCHKNRTKMALLFLDLDNFKRINDTLGHDAGDRLLTTIAERVVSCVRHEDIVSRLGGDEFTVLLGGLESVEPAAHIAEKILLRLREPIDLGREKIIATVSIGITLAPDHANNPIDLMKNADIAMYKSKEAGRNVYSVYHEGMDPEGADTLKLEMQLRTALEENQFKVYYQPQINIKTGKVVGLEALTRWDHPEKGLLSPKSFLDKVEEFGLIMALTKWTLDTACKEMRRTDRVAQSLSDLKLAINISAGQFRDPNLVEFIKSILESTEFPPHRLELEVTETSLISSLEASIETMVALRALGVTISIDDFGTGYASLSYLRKLPVDFVKIDSSFIKDIPFSKSDMEITSAVIAMSHKLNLKVLAEGVETPAQMQFLLENKCDYAQGYYISPPLPMEALLSIDAQISTLHEGNVHHLKIPPNKTLK